MTRCEVTVLYEGRSEVGAPPAAVWPVLLDVNQLAALLPGVQQVTQVNDTTFEGVIVAAVGPISGRFTLRGQIVEAVEPSLLRVHVPGTDSVTKSILTSDVRLALTPVGADSTDLAYRSQVDVKGRMALLGDLVLRATATVMVDEFIRRLKARVEA